jgi:hypothetical protein
MMVAEGKTAVPVISKGDVWLMDSRGKPHLLKDVRKTTTDSPKIVHFRDPTGA